jgi:hypothetical protein
MLLTTDGRLTTALSDFEVDTLREHALGFVLMAQQAHGFSPDPSHQHLS